MKLLPHWVLTDKSPAFYDSESATAIEQTAKVYGAMQDLITEYNSFVDRINQHITDFNASASKDYGEFKVALRQEFQDFIDVIELKLDREAKTISDMLSEQNTNISNAVKSQDSKIGNAILYMKDNLTSSINSAINDLRKNGGFSDEVRKVFEELTNSLDTLDSRVNTFTTLAAGSTTGDAELIDARTDYSGKTWDNLGSHIRGVSNQLNNVIGSVKTGLIHNKMDNSVVYKNQYTNAQGVFTSKDGVDCHILDVTDSYIIVAKNVNFTKSLSVAGYLFFYNSADEIIDFISLGNNYTNKFENDSVIQKNIHMTIAHTRNFIESKHSITVAKIKLALNLMSDDAKNTIIIDENSPALGNLINPIEIDDINLMQFLDSYNSENIAYDLTTRSFMYSSDHGRTFLLPLKVKKGDVILSNFPPTKDGHEMTIWGIDGTIIGSVMANESNRYEMKSDGYAYFSYGNDVNLDELYIYKLKNKTQWAGKKWYACGTSLTSTSYGKYTTPLASISGLVEVNLGVPNGTIVPSTRPSIMNSLNNISDDAELITLECVVNDWDENVTLGAFGDTDSSTYYGALYNAFNIITSKPNATVVGIVMHTGVDTGTSCHATKRNDLGLFQKDYIKAFVEMCDAFGVECIRADKCGININTGSLYLTDNIHQSDLGGRLTADYIWNKLKHIQPRLLS